jgi:hypothetical protein
MKTTPSSMRVLVMRIIIAGRSTSKGSIRNKGEIEIEKPRIARWFKCEVEVFRLSGKGFDPIPLGELLSIIHCAVNAHGVHIMNKLSGERGKEGDPIAFKFVGQYKATA